MVEEQILSRGMEDKKVLEAMERTPRHKFVPERYISQAYKDHPLPIGYGQTISQPYMVALMTQCLKLTGEVPPSGLKVLEIGTGSGYQAAILSELLKGKVYTIEIIEELGVSAARLLRALNYKNVEVKIGDGYFGWKEKAPFDRIIVTCAPDHLPAPLTEQLKEGGIMVIPVGPPGSYQTLWQIEKKEGKLIFNNMGGCIFVPFRRK
ncbi:protein-L-isoaspartate O-methyltransferase [Candidatus Desantisbacteria bacterium CG_4_10_14_0_8_um_filter_39_17]|uniref:Protein-L-isoaspartate O-methyltransferase n=1 Tax=Candidatus Desantisbacteria bacterium CG_4_10_14_0_8_um_filter_39_17 TaxID=1974542 RepID=A0A2H9PAF9_9BACT|nr:MAG: protein-L-isoaspartate O-methyltransferase [Candidatus Desantisbacteria bacterium CG_4_10_14_0_8_um_filter_39_17]